MSYWLYVTTKQNWEITESQNVLGIAGRHRNILTRLKIGDKSLIYTKQERINQEMVEAQIMAEYEIVSQPFDAEKEIFKTPGKVEDFIYKVLVKVKPLKIYEEPISFKSLVPNLSFIKNKHYWSISLRGRALTEIPEKDYNLITSQA